MMRSSILGASTMLNVLIQHLPLQSLFWTKIWRAFRASDPSRQQGEGSRTHDGRARRLGRTRQRGKARRSSAGRATTRRLIGGWAGRRLAARCDGWQGDDQTALQGDDQTRRLTDGQGATEGKTRRGQGAGHTTMAGRATTRRRCRARRCRATTGRDGWRIGRARRRARRDDDGAQATRRQ